MLTGLFLLFTLTNSLLAYGSLPVWEKWLVGLGGLALPWGIAWKLSQSHEKDLLSSLRQELLSFPSPWILALLGLGAVYLRFTQLTSLSLWPLTDEAKSGYYSMELAAHGRLKFLYDFSQLPPLFIWLQGLFFKLFGVSLSSLWAFPAILSCLTVWASYRAARVFFSKSFALLFSSLTAFSFWPLYVGRFSHPGCLLLLWECLALWLLGTLKNPETGPQLRKYGFYLGLLTGAGFYSFTSWPTVALVMTLWIFFFRRRVIAFFLGGTFLVYLPLGIAWVQNSYGGYLHQVWSLNPAASWDSQILRGFWDFSAFFWKSLVPPNLFAYKPFWGGYLNPLLGACFFLGAFVFLRQAPKPWVWFGSLAFLIFYLPGFLTGGLEMFRVLPILPLILALAALGLLTLLAALQTSRRWLILTLFFLLSLGTDSYHLFGAYHSVWTHPQDNWFASKSLERLRASQILEDLKKDLGPGLILSELVPDLYDQSLAIATFSYNRQINPAPGPSRGQWVAILTNVHYQPFLAKDLPGGRWIRLAPDVDRPDGGLVLGITVPSACDPEFLNRLAQADLAMRELVPLVFDNRDYKPRGPVIEKLQSLYPLFHGNRFLEACYWEKIAENDYGDRNYDGQVAALRQAIEKGYPAAHLYNDLGALYLRRSRFKEARGAFEKALRCAPNETSAAAGMQLLKETEKTGQKPKD